MVNDKIKMQIFYYLKLYWKVFKQVILFFLACLFSGNGHADSKYKLLILPSERTGGEKTLKNGYILKVHNRTFTKIVYISYIRILCGKMSG